MTVPSDTQRYAVLGITALVVLSLLSLLLYQSLLGASAPDRTARLGLDAYEAVLADSIFWWAFFTTAILAVGMTVIALPIGAVMAFVIVRTDLPGRRWLEPLIILPIFVPPFVLAVGYVAALGADGASTGAASLQSLFGLILIAGLTHVPYVYFCAAVALRGLGTDAEDAARVAGASPLKAAIDTSIPMALPALLFAAALVFAFGFESFGLPLVIGEPGGVTVLTTYLYRLAGGGGGPPYQVMAVIAVTIAAVAGPLAFLQRMLLRRASHPIPSHRASGKATTLRLGRWRWPVFAAFALWWIVVLLIPVAGAAMRSLTTGEGIAAAWTLEHYRALFDRPQISRAIGNTLFLGVFGGALAVACYTAIAQATYGRQTLWTRIATHVMTASRAMPGIIAGFAVLILFLSSRLFAPLVSTIVAIWLAYLVAWLGFGVPLIGRLLRQIHPEQQEVARSMGANSMRVTRDVTLPLIRQGMLLCWLLAFIVFAREYATGVLLFGPGAEVIGTTLVSLWSAGAIDLTAALSMVHIAIVGTGLALVAATGVRTHG